MTGLVGWFDPDGVDPRRLAVAARSTPYRGDVSTLQADPCLVIGSLGDGGAIHESVGSHLLVDGRIDAILRGPAVIASEGSSVELLHERLDRRGPEALNEFAADFALALVSGPGAGVLLARDAFGLRPLYVAERGRRFAFASEPAILIALGMATDDLDPEVVSAFLGGRHAFDGRTAFAQIREVPPGAWVRLNRDGRRSEGRWFDPEDLRRGSLPRRDAIEALRDALGASVIARARGGKTAVALSGGRDSGSVMVAAARAGLDATGITQTYDADLPVNESHLARALCDTHHMAWMEAPVASCPTWNQMEDVPAWSGGPVTYPVVPESVAIPDVASDAGFDVIMTGDGESLFAASELVVFDLMRSGRPLAAIRAAKAFRHVWGRSFTRQAKVAGRALAPRSVLEARDRLRPEPPWVCAMSNPGAFVGPQPRSDRTAMLWDLKAPYSTGYSLDERLYRTRGMRFTCPLLDLRVVSIALSLEPDDRAPIRTPKPALAAAFLGELADSRVKMSFVPYYRRLARRTQAAFPDLFSPESLASQRGFIDPAGLDAVSDETWLQHSLAVSVLEMWLRRPV